MPQLVPVEGNPFASAAPKRAPTLVPVEGNPFAPSAASDGANPSPSVAPAEGEARPLTVHPDTHGAPTMAQLPPGWKDGDPIPSHGGATGSWDDKPKGMSIPQALLQEGKNLVGGVKDAVTLPGDVYKGKVDPMSEEGMDRASNLAGLISGGETVPRVARAGARLPASAPPERVEPTMVQPRSTVRPKLDVVQGGAPKLVPVEGNPFEKLTKAPEVKPEPKPQAVGAAVAHPADILADTRARQPAPKPQDPSLKEGLQSAAKLVRSALSPERVDASAGRAAGGIRQALGRSARDSEQTKLALQSFSKDMKQLDLHGQIDVIDWLQERGTKTAQGYEPAPEIKPVLDTIRQAFLDRRAKLEASPSTEQMRFIEDYFPQQWKDIEKAKQFAQTFGTKEGSGGFTKERKIPTYADGIRAGLDPVSTDPVEGTLRYVENVDRYIATNEAFDNAVHEGDVLWRKPGNQPDGWKEINGRMSSRLPGQKAYAPEGWAQVYNNFTSRRPEGVGGDLLELAHGLTSKAAAFKLGLSGFHAVNMAQEAVTGGVANAIDTAMGGRPAQALVKLAGAPLKPITSVAQGKRLVKAYLEDKGSPQMLHVAALAAEANFRVIGKGRVADEYRFTGAGNLVKSWKDGTLAAEAAAGLKRGGVGLAKGNPLPFAKAMLEGTGRVLETISDPLFQHYIPLIKNGAYFDGLKTWLDKHPGASIAEQVQAARDMADVIDNRFGEMNQDNIFWSKTQKMMAQSALLSYSYTLGTGRLATGAIRDTLNMRKGGWTSNQSYALALPLVSGAVGAMATYMMTGKTPEDYRDLYYPRTGGTDITTGQPERMVLPSYMNTVFGFYHHPGQEVLNKLNPLWSTVEQGITGKDWKGDEISLSTDSTVDVVKNYLDFMLKAFAPISVESENKKGSALGPVSRTLIGVRPAPMAVTDPERQKSLDAFFKKKADDTRKRHDMRHLNDYGN